VGTRGRVWDGGGGNVGTRVRSAVGPAMDRTVRVAFIAWATRDGRTAIGVSVGRHAGSCCCVKRESAEAEMGRGRRVGVRGSVFGAGLFGARGTSGRDRRATVGWRSTNRDVWTGVGRSLFGSCFPISLLCSVPSRDGL
jgi:hypothetical protein